MVIFSEKEKKMKTLAKGIVKLRYLILVIAVVLLFPSAIGYMKMRINYDILTYLPKNIETMKGQDILEDEFGVGAYSMYVVEGMDYKDVAKLKKKIEAVPHVHNVLWYDSIADISIPVSMIPDKYRKAFDNGDATMMFVIFDNTTSSDDTMNAVKKIRKISNKQCFLAGMSGLVEDTKELAEKETPVYVLIAVVLAVIVLSLTMDSFLIPLFFLLSIGMAIIYNMGTNRAFGEISFITQCIAAVLQLGVTMDYSIFLWHSYQEQLGRYPDDKNKAMSTAIVATFQSVIGSSVTTIAGFIALCFMSFRIGLDLGLVMAKGVLIGVICCLTVLPSMVLIFDNALEKTRHRPLLGEFKKIPKFISKYYWIFGLIFLLILPFAIFGETHTKVYYNLAGTLPSNLPSMKASSALDKNFESNTSYMVLYNVKMKSKDKSDMQKDIADVKGVDSVIGLNTFFGPAVPESMIPKDVSEMMKSKGYEMCLITSKYKVASDEVNDQIDTVKKITKGYDKKSMVVGEAPCTKDLITVTNRDFQIVNWVSIALVFIIIAVVLKSASLPFILVAVIEFAIFINMGLPYYTHTTLPFVASIVIGTIQLGSTVDYAILMTTRYLWERNHGKGRTHATREALSASMKSIIVSALSFFGATFGVGLVSSIDMISSLCSLMARGALISMVVVILVLPSMYMIFDPLIVRTTAKCAEAREYDRNKKKLQA